MAWFELTWLEFWTGHIETKPFYTQFIQNANHESSQKIVERHRQHQRHRLLNAVSTIDWLQMLINKCRQLRLNQCTNFGVNDIALFK